MEGAMLRMVFFVLVALAGVYLVVRLCSEMSRHNIDWRGVGLGVGFVMIALYLRNVTNIGGFV
jgi:hypothetical protein